MFLRGFSQGRFSAEQVDGPVVNAMALEEHVYGPVYEVNMFRFGSRMHAVGLAWTLYALMGCSPDKSSSEPSDSGAPSADSCTITTIRAWALAN